MKKSKTSQSTDNSIILPKETIELNRFLAIVVDTTMQTYPTIFAATKIKCNKKGCDGIINTKMHVSNEKVMWKCSICENGGIIGTGLNGITEL